jgi:hypothetical protein
VPLQQVGTFRDPFVVVNGPDGPERLWLNENPGGRKRRRSKPS